MISNILIVTKDRQPLIFRRYDDFDYDDVHVAARDLADMISGEPVPFISLKKCHYFFQHLGSDATIFVGTKNSIDSLEFLKLVQIVFSTTQNAFRGQSLGEIASLAIELIFKWDEIASALYLEKPSEQYFNNIIKMESHEEEIFNIITKVTGLYLFRIKYSRQRSRLN
jgi:hypothetical protein